MSYNNTSEVLVAIPVVEEPDTLDFSENTSMVDGVEIWNSVIEYSVVYEHIDGHKVTFCTMRPHSPLLELPAFWITLENEEESRTNKLSLQKAILLRDYLNSPEMAAILAAVEVQPHGK